VQFDIEAPVNGRIHKANITLKGDGGAVLFSDHVDLRAAVERKKLAGRPAERLGKDAADLLEKLESRWNKVVADREQRQEEATAAQARPHDTPAEEVAVLDAFPATIRRPLCLIEGHAYAAAWVPLQVTVHRGTEKDGTPVYYDPPITRAETVLVMVRDDGAAFSGSAAPWVPAAPGAGCFRRAAEPAADRTPVERGRRQAVPGRGTPEPRGRVRSRCRGGQQALQRTPGRNTC
jgi:hypothetical protein